MVVLGFMVLVLSLASLLIFTTGILSILIVLEMMSLSLFLVMISYILQEGIKEVVIFFVVIVSEALLGLILMVMKVMLSGDDMLNLVDVI